MPIDKKKKNILLIDDNLSFLKSLRMALSKIGYVCEITQSATEARELLDRYSFDLIVSDYFMPECDGKEILQKLGDLHPECRLILTSSYPLDVEFKKSDRFIFIDKLGILEWLTKKYPEVQYV